MLHFYYNNSFLSMVLINAMKKDGVFWTFTRITFPIIYICDNTKLFYYAT